MSSTGLATTAPSSLRTFDYKPGVPASMQWNAGVQMALPWSLALDFSYVGNHAWDQWTSSQNPNSIDIGMAFDPVWQDRTQPTVTTANPNYSLVSTNVNQAHFYKEYGSISNITFNQWQTYHSLQISLTRRMKNGIAVGFADTIGLYDHSKINDRFKHDYVNRTITNRDDQQQAQDLLGNNNPNKSRMNATFTYALPKLTGNAPVFKALGPIINDWQLSGIWTMTTAGFYTISHSYQNNGTNLYLTGSPDYGARVYVIGDPGNGCRLNEADRLKQFNTSAFKGPGVGSVGLESGNNYMKGCTSIGLDLAINRTVRLGESRTVQMRVDMFNAPNLARISGRNTSMSLGSPSDPTTILNLPYDSAGNVIASRSKPRGAGFGVATDYQSPRTTQFTIRFNF